jgi:hypothetical protein
MSQQQNSNSNSSSNDSASSASDPIIQLSGSIEQFLSSLELSQAAILSKLNDLEMKMNRVEQEKLTLQKELIKKIQNKKGKDDEQL